jgi:hypothetical protein
MPRHRGNEVTVNRMKKYSVITALSLIESKSTV